MEFWFELLAYSEIERTIVENGKSIDYDMLYRVSRDGLEVLAQKVTDSAVFKEFEENPHYLIVTYVVAKVYPIYQSVINFFQRLVQEGED